MKDSIDNKKNDSGRKENPNLKILKRKRLKENMLRTMLVDVLNRY